MRLFISYGEPDRAFAEAAERALTTLGLDVFLFSRSPSTGKKLYRIMHDEVTQADFVLLICSAASLKRAGVRNEIEEALQEEARRGGETVLVPLTLDDHVYRKWKPSYAGHAAAVKARTIGDFRNIGPRSVKFSQKMLLLKDELAKISPRSENRRSSIKVERVWYRVDIRDDDGKNAKITYTQKFYALSEKMKTIEVPGITGTGMIKFLRCSMDGMVVFENEGGNRRMIVYPKTLMPRNKALELVAEFEAIDAYTEREEAASVSATDDVEFIEIAVSLPAGRAATKASLIRIYADERTVLPGRYRFGSGRSLRARIPKPVPQATYLLAWQC